MESGKDDKLKQEPQKIEEKPKVAPAASAAPSIVIAAAEAASKSLTIDPANFAPDKYYDELTKMAQKNDYSTLESSILIHLDHLDGVKSEVHFDKKYPTGVAFIRDATNAKELAKRLKPNDPIVLADNLLLRSMNTMRSIDRALEFKEKGAEKDSEKKPFTAERAALKIRFQHLIFAVNNYLKKDYKKDENHEKAFKLIQTQFNTDLIQTLHNTKLDDGLKEPAEYAKLLGHYRDLAALLDPAKSMVTTLQHKTQNNQKKDVVVTHIETSHPITEKTDAQKEQLKVMANVDSKQWAKNFHSHQTTAMQTANTAFYDLMQENDRRLPAQTRKTIGPTIKNGYVVHNEIEVKASDGKPIGRSDFWSLRCGSPVYIGKGEKPALIEYFTRENLHQLEKAITKMIGVNKPNLHFTTLLTYAGGEGQTDIIDVMDKTRKENGNNWTYAPSNALGRTRHLNISSLIRTNAAELNVELPSALAESPFGDMGASRIAKVGQIVLLASRDAITTVKATEAPSVKVEANDVKPITFSVVFCASGQDRTGTAQEVATEMWAATAYTQLGLPGTRQDIEAIRALGCHNAVLASLAVTGSTGIKNDSLPGAYFSPLTNEYFYRDATAKTNKDPPIDTAEVSRIINQSQHSIVTPTEKSDVKVENSCKEDFTWISHRIDSIHKEYVASHGSGTAKTHAKHIEELSKDIRIHSDKKLDNAKKLDDIVKMLAAEWKKGCDAKIKSASDKRDPSDKMIDLLNTEQYGHSYYRGIGALLQNIAERFPDLKEKAQISPNRKVISERAQYVHAVKEEEFKALKEAIGNLYNLNKQNPESKALFEFCHRLNTDVEMQGLKHSHAYTEIVSELNRTWRQAAIRANSSVIFGRSSNPIHEQIDYFVTQLNNKHDKPNADEKFIRGIATLLQSIQNAHPNIIRPPIPDKLKEQKEFKLTPPR